MTFSESQDRFSENVMIGLKKKSIHAFKVPDAQCQVAVYRELLANLQGGLCPGVVVGVSVQGLVGF